MTDTSERPAVRTPRRPSTVPSATRPLDALFDGDAPRQASETRSRTISLDGFDAGEAPVGRPRTTTIALSPDALAHTPVVEKVRVPVRARRRRLGRTQRIALIAATVAVVLVGGGAAVAVQAVQQRAAASAEAREEALDRRVDDLEQDRRALRAAIASLTGAHAELMASVGPATDLATRVTQAMDRAVDVLPAEQIDAVRAAAGGLSDEAGRAGAVALPADLEVPDDRPASIAQAEEEIAATEERAAAVTAARDGIDASSDALAGAHAALLAALDTAYGTLAGVAEAEHDANPLPAAYLHEALDVAADAVLAARAAGGEGLAELDEFIAAVDVLRQEQARLAALEAADDGIGYTPVTPPSSSGGGDTGGDTGGGTGTETPAPTDPQPTDPSQPTEEPVPPPDTGTESGDGSGGA
jgi:type II secretory pathway pseudopilin PulG